MTRCITFIPRRTGLWLCLYIVTISGLVANHYWQPWANKYRAQVSLDLSQYTIDADYILVHATRSWLPWPWESHKITLGENIVQIERSIRLKFDEFETSELSDVSWNNFKHLVSQWDARNKACQIARQLNLDNYDCQNSEKLPNAWVTYFEKKFNQFYFISYVDGRPIFGKRESNEIQYCNTSPITSKFTVLQQLATLELSKFYQIAMQRDQYFLEKTGTEIIYPGECRHRRILSYDIPANVAFNVVPQSPELEAWFFDNWKRYHATWLNNPVYVEQLIQQTRQNIAITLCDNFQESESIISDISSENIVGGNCVGGQLQTYLYGQYLSSPNHIIFASNYPGFSDYSQYLNNEGVLKHIALDDILQEASELAPIVKQQFILAQAWGSKVPRFEIGASLNDVSGPFAFGVEASQIPQTTILDDAIEIPRQGIIYNINGQDIYSVYDIHEILTKHGDMGGIMSPIIVNIYNELGVVNDASYTTRFRFNPLAWQHFDTDVGSLEIGFYAFAFKSTGLSCMGKDVFFTISSWLMGNEYESNKHCSWVDQQRYAYARQMNPVEFDSSVEFGSFAGAVIVPGGFLKGFKLLSGARRMSTLGRIALAGTAEAIVMNAHAQAEGAPSEAPEERSARGFEAAKEGFLYGSAFALVLR